MDTEFGLIRRIEVTTVSVHDSQVDLARNGEVRFAIDDFFCSKTKWYDAAMKEATRDHPLGHKDEMRNKRISRIRSPIERSYAFVKRVCKAGHVAVTTVPRVRVK
jgi:IS5 family transposase